MKSHLSRYSRQIILDEVGELGQEKLSASKVLVVGAGGLGSPIIQYLAAAGVGLIRIIDGDTVSETNLHRQILFAEGDVGKAKVEVAREWVLKQNPRLKVEVFNKYLSKENVSGVLEGVDIVVDGSDNFSTKYLLNDATDLLSLPLVSGSIFKFTGQVSVFNFKNGPSYRCLYPDMPDAGEVPNCEEAGVIGVLPGIIGSIQVNEVLKLILGYGDLLVGKLFTFDLKTMESNLFEFGRSAAKIEKLADSYDLNCEVGLEDITVEQLEKGNYLILDVREEFEVNIALIPNSLHIPLGELMDRLKELKADLPIATLCHHGIRSQQAKMILEMNGFNNVVNVSGGIDAYSIKVDPAIPRY